MSARLLRSPVMATVREVGTFDGDASPIAVLEMGERQFRLPVTLDEARFLGAFLNQSITMRLAIEAPQAATKETPDGSQVR